MLGTVRVRRWGHRETAAQQVGGRASSCQGPATCTSLCAPQRLPGQDDHSTLRESKATVQQNDSKEKKQTPSKLASTSMRICKQGREIANRQVSSNPSSIVRCTPILCTTKGMGLPRWLSDKESAGQCRRCRFNPWGREIPWRKTWQPTPISLPGESHGQRSRFGYSP